MGLLYILWIICGVFNRQFINASFSIR
jgi:hypothetical protein